MSLSAILAEARAELVDTSTLFTMNALK
ncbi:MAG: hypothetical protein RLZZ214_2333, partial [Verrucomicrobiota bacterium]